MVKVLADCQRAWDAFSRAGGQEFDKAWDFSDDVFLGGFLDAERGLRRCPPSDSLKARYLEASSQHMASKRHSRGTPSPRGHRVKRRRAGLDPPEQTCQVGRSVISSRLDACEADGASYVHTHPTSADKLVAESGDRAKLEANPSA
jgi:hypothetical protein